MKYEWMDEYFLSKKGAEKNFKPEWDATVYIIGGKIFAIRGGSKLNRPLITLKGDPLFGKMLREQYKDIIPGYHINKEHWSSVYLDGDTPDGILKQMIDMSYALVLNSLTKKAQKDILEA